MKVLLLDNLRGIGYMGDVKEVRDGYARNYLFPRKLAKLATKITEKEVAALRTKREIALEQEQNRAAEAATKLRDISISVTEKANDTGTLFASIGKREIVRSIREVSGVQLAEDMILSDDPIKTVGDHTIELRLSSEIHVTVTLRVVAEKKGDKEMG